MKGLEGPNICSLGGIAARKLSLNHGNKFVGVSRIHMVDVILIRLTAPISRLFQRSLLLPTSYAPSTAFKFMILSISFVVCKRSW